MAGSWRRALFGLGGMALAVTAAGCGGTSSRSSTSGSGSVPPAQVRTYTQAPNASAALAAAVAITEGLGGVALTQTITASAQAPGGSAPAQSVTIGGTGTADLAGGSGALALKGPGGQMIQVRSLGTTVYLSTPNLSSIDGGKPWVKVTRDDYEKQLARGIPILAPLPDPTPVLDLIKGAAGSFSRQGPSTTGGVATTVYTGTLDLSAEAAGFIGSAAGLTAQQQQAVKAAFAAVPVQVAVDDQGRIRATTATLTVGGESLATTYGLGGFGTAVSVAAPASSQTTDGTSILPKLGSLLGGASSGSGSTPSGAG